MPTPGTGSPIESPKDWLILGSLLLSNVALQTRGSFKARKMIRSWAAQLDLSIVRVKSPFLFGGGTRYQRQYNVTLKTAENATRFAEIIVGDPSIGMMGPEPGFEVTWLDKPRTYARKRPPFDPQ
jgi:hypothetical protein